MMNFINWYIGLFADEDNKVRLAAWTATIGTISFVITFIFKPSREYIFKLFKRDTLNKTSELQPTIPKDSLKTEFEFANVTPTSIKEEIANAPLMMQEQIASHYIGLHVNWSLSLFLIQKGKGDNITVTLVPGPFPSSYPNVIFETTTERYPILKIAKSEKKFQVIGKIIDCRAYNIDLEIESIKEIN